MIKMSHILGRYSFLLTVILLLVVFVVLVPKQPKVVNNTQSQAITESSNQIFTPDWGVASTLLAMGYTPQAIPEIKNYEIWATTPQIPSKVKDVGLRYFPNMELLSTLSIDTVLDIDFYQLLRPLYPQVFKDDITIVTANLGRERTDLYAKPQWQELRQSLITISQQAKPNVPTTTHDRLVDSYMSERQIRIEQASKRIKAVLGDGKQFAIVNMYDTRSVNFVAKNSLIQLTMDMMELPMITRGKASQWGTADRNISELLDLPDNTCLIINKPITPFFKHQLQQSLIWKNTKFSKPHACLYVVNSVWLTAGVESMVNFAEHFADAVEADEKEGLNHE